MGEWRRRIRSGIIRSSRVPLIRTLYRKACQLATWMVGRKLASIPGVAAVYARHSHPRFVTFAPGESDLDLTLVLDDGAAQDASVVRACTETVDALSRVFGFVFPQDARFVTRRELAQIEAWPGSAEILSEPSGWIRIGGREVRRAGQLRALAREDILLHPEFNAWWRNVLQTHILTPQASLAEGHMRLSFRVAMKSQLHLQVGRGRMAPPAEAYLPDAAAATLFAEDAEMAALLGDLERKGFWAHDGEARKARILHRSLALAAEFYRDLPVPLDAAWVAPAPGPSAGPSAVIAEAHRSELCDRFDGEGALRSIAETILMYPTPHWAPCEYQIDILLHDEVAPAAFDDAVRAIKRSFGGRTFGIRGTHAQLTMVPRRAFEHPWYLLGTPFPFLHEHLATFAEILLGSPPRIPAPPPRPERLRWCARYFLFHRFTLRYRPRYVSKDCNFCQLAAIRLFLEYGAVLTDAAQVRRAYLDAFVKGREEERQALDFLLCGNGQLPDDVSFAAVLQLQSREYDSVEAWLRREGALS